MESEKKVRWLRRAPGITKLRYCGTSPSLRDFHCVGDLEDGRVRHVLTNNILEI